VRFRGVIFDLWDTLADWPVADSRAHRERLVAHLGVADETFERVWNDTFHVRETGPLDAAYRALGLADEHVATHVADRHEIARRTVRPRAGVLETLDELRARGHRLGLISMCTEDVPAVWAETEFSGRFDAETFSATCGLVKPDPEIFLSTAAAIGVEPADCLYVGDGGSNELEGARRVGMTAVYIEPIGREPYSPEVHSWDGLRITAIPQVLDLV
jgi:putative hydrolase of the HAD superfamily